MDKIISWHRLIYIVVNQSSFKQLYSLLNMKLERVSLV